MNIFKLIPGRRGRALLMVGVMGAGLALAACAQDDVSTPSAMCAFVLGDGQDGHDSKVHKTVYPGQKTDHDEQSEVVKYFPCNSRNYIINPQGQNDANGHPIGDRHTPSQGFTDSGTEIRVWSQADWTVNQDQHAMLKFWETCYKYTCASGDSAAGTANFSTEGWNGMLGELFGTSVDAAVFKATSGISDDIWRKHDAKLYDQLATQMADIFNDEIRRQTGYDLDIFCGSGNSTWSDPSNPGNSDNVFTCTNVRFKITGVEVVDPSLNQQATKDNQVSQEDAAIQKRLSQARELYGDNAQEVLANLDTINACVAAEKATCVIYVGGTPNTVPTPAQPVVIPAATTPPTTTG